MFTNVVQYSQSCIPIPPFPQQNRSPTCLEEIECFKWMLGVSLYQIIQHYRCSAVTEHMTAEHWRVPLSVTNFPSVCSAKSQSDYTPLDFTLKL